MANLEINKLFKRQLELILKDSEPWMERFEETQALIERAKETLYNILDFLNAIEDSFFSPDPHSARFTVGGAEYVVNYFLKDGGNIEESLTITRDNKERIRMHTYKYEDGRVHSDISYYDSGPDFEKVKYLDPKSNKNQALLFIEELEGTAA